MVQSQETHRSPLRPVLETHVTVTSATYSAKGGDRLIGVNRAGAVTVTLPTAQLRPGRTYTVKDESGAAGTNNITVATEGSETIDGSATDVISDNYGSKTYYSDGSNWFTVPLLAVGSHTLASHSARAHSDLTGTGTDDHHAQSHTPDSHAAGTLQHEKGGLEADVSSGDGFVEIKGGSTTVIKSKTDATAAPGVGNDTTEGYSVGSVWIDITNDKAYVCLDITEGAAVWTEITVTGGGPSQATQAALEAETDENTYAPPDLIKHSPGVAKVWCQIAADGTLSSPDHGVSTVTDTGTGDRTSNFTTAFSSSVFSGVATPFSSGDDIEVKLGVPTAGSMQLIIENDAGTAADKITGQTFHGDQA